MPLQSKNKYSAPDGVYSIVHIPEHYLFEDNHTRHLTQIVTEQSDELRGVCFAVHKSYQPFDSNYYHLFVPFKEQDGTNRTTRTLIAEVMATISDLSRQLQQQVRFH